MSPDPNPGSLEKAGNLYFKKIVFSSLMMATLPAGLGDYSSLVKDQTPLKIPRLHYFPVKEA